MDDAPLNTLVVRTDGNEDIGLGHIMRCLSISSAWNDTGGDVLFVSKKLSKWAHDAILGEGARVQTFSASSEAADIRTTIQLATRANATWVLLDGYEFSAEYQNSLKTAGFQLTVIDDTSHLPFYDTDILVNYGLSARSLRYKISHGATLLLGPDYVPLRPQFTRRASERTAPHIASNILITMGAADPGNGCASIIKLSKRIEGSNLKFRAITSPTNPRLDELKSIAGEDSRIEILTSVTNMASLMEWADLAIASAGGTCWELAFMGVPTCLVVLVENQRLNALAFSEAGAVHFMEGVLNSSEDEVDRHAQGVSSLIQSQSARERMIAAATQLCDGRGAGRIVSHMAKQSIRLRRVEMSDLRVVWEWLNRPEVRAVSFTSDPIPWSQHVQWFSSKLQDQACTYFVSTDEQGSPTGQVRYESEGDHAVVSVCVAPEQRGRGYGARLLRVASRALFQCTAVSKIHAYIKPSNQSSVRAFTLAGYKKSESTTFRGQDALLYELPRKSETEAHKAPGIA